MCKIYKCADIIKNNVDKCIKILEFINEKIDITFRNDNMFVDNIQIKMQTYIISFYNSYVSCVSFELCDFIEIDKYLTTLPGYKHSIETQIDCFKQQMQEFINKYDKKFINDYGVQIFNNMTKSENLIYEL